MSFNKEILELLRQLKKLSHEYFQKNTTLKNGTEFCIDNQPDRELIYICMSVPALVIVFILSVFNERKSFFKNINRGRPGLVVPMNSIEMRDTLLPYILAFIAISNLIIDIFRRRLGMKFMELQHNWVKVMVKLIVIGIYGIVAYPIMAAISQKSLLGYTTGIMYTSTLTALLIYFITASLCLPNEAIIYSFLTNFPSLISMIAIIIYFTTEILKLRGCLNNDKSLVREDKELLIVKRILTKNSSKKNKQRSRPSLSKLLLHYINKKFNYFNYPPRLLCSLAVAFVLLYSMVIEISFYVFPLLQTIIGILEDILPGYKKVSISRVFWETSIGSTEDEVKFDRYLSNIGYLILFYLKAFRSCFITSFLLAFLINAFHIPMIMLSFNNQFRIISKKGLKRLSPENSTSPFFLVLGFIRYTGYQVGYLVWGFIIQLFVLLILFSLLTFVIYIPVIYEASPILWNVIEKNIPWILFTILFYILQVIMTKMFFTYNFGNTLAIDNRQAFFIWTYISFFYNIFIGLFTGLWRILLSLISGIISLGRLDFSLLPRPCELMDNGYSNYLGFLFTEHFHNNPILITFVKLMTETVKHKQLLNDVLTSSYASSTAPIISSANNRMNSTEEIVDEKITRARIRWQLAYTLVNNLGLVYHRKHYLKHQQSENSSEIETLTK